MLAGWLLGRGMWDACREVKNRPYRNFQSHSLDKTLRLSIINVNDTMYCTISFMTYNGEDGITKESIILWEKPFITS